MKKFMFLYKGFVTPTSEIGQAWMEWFGQVGDKMTDSGNPMTGGVEVTPDDVTANRAGNRVSYRLLDRERRKHGGGGGTREDESDDHQCGRLRIGPHVARRKPNTPSQGCDLDPAVTNRCRTGG